MLSCGEGGSTGAEVINQINANTSDIEAINAVADVYETESNTDILDIPDTYTNINNLVIPNLPAGQYLVGVSFTYHLSVTNKRIDYRWLLNGVEEDFNDSPKDAISNVARCYVFPFTQATEPLLMCGQTRRRSLLLSKYFSNLVLYKLKTSRVAV